MICSHSNILTPNLSLLPSILQECFSLLSMGTWMQTNLILV